MDYKIIESLLERYFDGASSLEEERQLQQFFVGMDVPEHLKMYQPLFQYFEVGKTAKIPADFDQKLLSKLQLPETQAVVKKLPVFTVWRVAAAVLLLAGVTYFLTTLKTPSSTEIDWSKYEPKDPKEAYEKTMAALALVSEKMNDGKKQTKKGMAEVNKANDAVQN